MLGALRSLAGFLSMVKSFLRRKHRSEQTVHHQFYSSITFASIELDMTLWCIKLLHSHYIPVIVLSLLAPYLKPIMTCVLTSHTVHVEIRGQAAGLVVLSFHVGVPGIELKPSGFATNTHHYCHSSTGASKEYTWQSIGTHEYQEAYTAT